MAQPKLAKSESREFARRLEAAGAEVRRPPGGGHWKVYWKGKWVGTIPSTPAGGFRPQVGINQMRRNGFDLIEEERKKMRAETRDRDLRLDSVRSNGAKQLEEAEKRIEQQNAAAKTPTPVGAANSQSRYASSAALGSWTKERCIQAAKEWVELHPEEGLKVKHWTPEGAAEFGYRMYVDFPHSSRPITLFGSWNKFVAAAGLQPRGESARGRRKDYTREGVLDAGVEFYRETGLLPNGIMLDIRPGGITRYRETVGADAEPLVDRLARLGLPSHSVVNKLFDSIDGFHIAIRNKVALDKVQPEIKEAPMAAEPTMLGTTEQPIGEEQAPPVGRTLAGIALRQATAEEDAEALGPAPLLDMAVQAENLAAELRKLHEQFAKQQQAMRVIKDLLG